VDSVLHYAEIYDGATGHNILSLVDSVLSKRTFSAEVNKKIYLNKTYHITMKAQDANPFFSDGIQLTMACTTSLTVCHFLFTADI
jgi:hypothetical protein